MKSALAALRTLVLPYGATTGARIELDGVNGEIRIFDSGGLLVTVIDSQGMFLSPDLNDFNAPGIYLQPSDSSLLVYPDATGTGLSYSAGRFTSSHFGATGYSPYTWITSPAITPVGPTDRCEMLLIGAGDTGEDPGIQINNALTFNMVGDCQLIVGGRITVDNHDIGAGYRAQVSSLAAIGPIVAETVVLTLVAFTFEAGRAYKVTMVGGLGTSAAGIQADMRLKKTSTAGATITEFFRYTGEGGNVTDMTSIRYCRNATGANITTDVVLTMNLVGGVGSVTGFAAIGNPRSLIIEDCGTSLDWSFANTV